MTHFVTEEFITTIAFTDYIFIYAFDTLSRHRLVGIQAIFLFFSAVLANCYLVVFVIICKMPMMYATLVRQRLRYNYRFHYKIFQAWYGFSTDQLRESLS